MTETKSCTVCHNAFPATTDFFYKKGSGIDSRCKECAKESNRNKRKLYPDRYKRYDSTKYNKHRDACIEYNRSRYASRKRGIIDGNTRRYHTRKVSDVSFRELHRLRGLVHQAIVFAKNSAASESLLGCTIAEARQWIENQFAPDMTWANHGNATWHIDHIKPCAEFDLSDISQQKLCFHYTNLRPLEAASNLKRKCSGGESCER